MKFDKAKALKVFDSKTIYPIYDMIYSILWYEMYESSWYYLVDDQIFTLLDETSSSVENSMLNYNKRYNDERNTSQTV